MLLPETVRLLAWRASPPPLRAVFRLADAPSQSVIKDDLNTFNPPPLLPASLLEIEDWITVTPLVEEKTPAPSWSAMLLSTEEPSLNSRIEESVTYAPPPSLIALLPLIEVLEAVKLLACSQSPPPFFA